MLLSTGYVNKVHHQSFFEVIILLNKDFMTIFIYSFTYKST